MSTLSVGTIKSNTSAPPVIQNTSGTEIGTFCRAWVNFNGTGTVAIRASFNVSSITDNGTGDYTVNLTTAMTDANHSAMASGYNIGSSNNICIGVISTTSSSANVRSEVSNGTAIDADPIFVAIFR